jgi:Ras GTPase-activating-like protein IQGAP2/3
MAAEQDVEVEDDLARGMYQPDSVLPLFNTNEYIPSAQKRLRDLKARISTQSKKNFVLERDVRYLDQRIALLIQNRMALDEVRFLSPSLFIKIKFIHDLSNVKSRSISRR